MASGMYTDCTLVLRVLFFVAGGAAGVYEVRGGDGGEGFFLGFGVDAFGAGEWGEGDGFAGVQGLHNAF